MSAWFQAANQTASVLAILELQKSLGQNILHLLCKCEDGKVTEYA